VSRQVTIVSTSLAKISGDCCPEPLQLIINKLSNVQKGISFCLFKDKTIKHMDKKERQKVTFKYKLYEKYHLA